MDDDASPPRARLGHLRGRGRRATAAATEADVATRDGSDCSESAGGGVDRTCGVLAPPPPPSSATTTTTTTTSPTTTMQAWERERELEQTRSWRALLEADDLFDDGAGCGARVAVARAARYAPSHQTHQTHPHVAHHHPYAHFGGEYAGGGGAQREGVARGVVSQLRRSHTVSGYGPSVGLGFGFDRTPPDLSAAAAAAAAASAAVEMQREGARHGANGRLRVARVGRSPPRGSLVDRLRASAERDPPPRLRGADGAPRDERDRSRDAAPVGRGARLPPHLRRTQSQPARVSDGRAFCSPTSVAIARDGAGAGAGADARGGFEVTFPASEEAAAAAAAAAAAQASDPRPFGYLGVTRPLWTTRWEANLVDPASAETVFLGNFSEKESAARAYDAAAMKARSTVYTGPHTTASAW
ncbi:uncharacterized protein MICPUCDRAFT_40168 [Micromonas pusilla CCMP1545]|uniref:Predicted protein n=1 Tax=Micromonas pusilla (strain CCMP1545) TaxID=564608 RepID=C1MUA3_MICPC|nr:uncharacterized protein MICPUCDRAFT_40168 [Micromonas pusilla CCMP1545]EEH56593.1 predicted protein [Micromonas pusilla CCMP1545]|eukprot:XP_003059461.1 predicted protein [Micromonas pusilla CCMP1545]